MNAPVHFKQTGIEELILKNANEHDPQYTYDAWDNDELLLGSRFRNPSAGGALYHESNYTAGRWRFTAGLRFDYEHTRLRYRSSTQTGYTATNRVSGTTGHYPLSIDIRNTLKRNFTEVLPKFSVLYAFDEIHNLYVSVAKGYKAGGFNTQMFSDVLQQKMMNEMGFGTVYDADKVVSYEPEYSWNYELGGHFSCMEGAVRGDFALFYIDCRDQQLTIFPEGTTTGRMMTNAGRTRSFGGELSLQVSPWQNLDINAAYGYTNAKFVRYNDGKTDYKGNYLPYAPQHTLSANGAWTIPTGGAVARKYRPAGRCPLRGAHLVERGEFALAAILCAGRSLPAFRTETLFGRHMGAQPRGRGLQRILFQVHRQRIRTARTSQDIRHNTEY